MTGIVPETRPCPYLSRCEMAKRCTKGRTEGKTTKEQLKHEVATSSPECAELPIRLTDCQPVNVKPGDCHWPSWQTRKFLPLGYERPIKPSDSQEVPRAARRLLICRYPSVEILPPAWIGPRAVEIPAPFTVRTQSQSDIIHPSRHFSLYQPPSLRVRNQPSVMISPVE